MIASRQSASTSKFRRPLLVAICIPFLIASSSANMLVRTPIKPAIHLLSSSLKIPPIPIEKAMKRSKTKLQPSCLSHGAIPQAVNNTFLEHVTSLADIGGAQTSVSPQGVCQ
ncbi:uncharacterized protein G2W53_034037 [Senna tora]|uniref:Uncharacterized protein n=1 Tax=Senna tora TaxID=362788 RepID=A0A834T2H5_9FABA|nr:uncharacterized protein G2W53_034037 [Senna tora]